MYVLLTRFEEKNTIQKGPLFPIFRKSSSIHEINPALIASIVLKKIYFHGICALSKNNGYFHAFLCIRSKSQILRVKNVKKYKISRILTLPSWQHWFNANIISAFCVFFDIHIELFMINCLL